MTRTSRALFYPVAASLLIAAGCDDTGVDPDDGTTEMSILLTDAPGDFEAAVVTITDIYFQPGEGEDASRVYLLEDASVTTDLLTLSNDAIELVDDQEMPAGTYEQLRFVISGGYIAVEGEDGSTEIYASSEDYAGLPAGAEVTGDLQMPSFAQSGLKVRLNGAAGDDDGSIMVPEGPFTLLVDFDVSQSFGQQAGNSGRWVMRPSISATNVQVSGGLQTSVTLPDTVTLPVLGETQLTLANFSATLAPAAGGDPKVVALTDSDSDGIYDANFVYLFPGEYNVGLQGPEGLTFTTDVATPLSVTINEGETASVALAIAAASLVQ